MEYHSGGSLPLLGRPRYCPGANANGGYLCETGHCCGETGCCTYYYELWWFWLLWTVLILLSCCCAYRHRRAKQRVQQQQRQRDISLLAYHGASYTSSMLDLSFLASLKLPSYEEVAAQPSTPPPPYSSVFTSPRYPQPPRTADPHLLTHHHQGALQHGPLLHQALSDGPSSLSSDNSSSCSCDSCCPSSPCSSSLSAPITYETDTSHASTPSEATPLAPDVTMETIHAAAGRLELHRDRATAKITESASVAIDIEEPLTAETPKLNTVMDKTSPNSKMAAVDINFVTISQSIAQKTENEATNLNQHQEVTNLSKFKVVDVTGSPLDTTSANSKMAAVDINLASETCTISPTLNLSEQLEATSLLKLNTDITGPPLDITTPNLTLPVGITAPIKQQLDLKPAMGSPTSPQSPQSNSLLSCVQSIKSPQDNFQKTYDTATSPKPQRTLTLILDSNGNSCQDKNPSLVPILAPSNQNLKTAEETLCCKKQKTDLSSPGESDALPFTNETNIHPSTVLLNLLTSQGIQNVAKMTFEENESPTVTMLENASTDISPSIATSELQSSVIVTPTTENVGTDLSKEVVPLSLLPVFKEEDLTSEFSPQPPNSQNVSENVTQASELSPKSTNESPKSSHSDLVFHSSTTLQKLSQIPSNQILNLTTPEEFISKSCSELLPAQYDLNSFAISNDLAGEEKVNELSNNASSLYLSTAKPVPSSTLHPDVLTQMATLDSDFGPLSQSVPQKTELVATVSLSCPMPNSSEDLEALSLLKPSNLSPISPDVLTKISTIDVASEIGPLSQSLPQNPCFSCPISNTLEILEASSLLKPSNPSLVDSVSSLGLPTSPNLNLEPPFTQFASENLPNPNSDVYSFCPAITIQADPPSCATSPSSPCSIPSPPASMLLLDPLAAMNQSEKSATSTGHASSLSPSPRNTQSPPKQTLFSPCVDVFEPVNPDWEDDEYDEDDEDDDMGADESQYRHRRLTGDSGIEVCRCHVEDEEEEEEEEKLEKDGDAIVAEKKHGMANSELHDSVDCPVRSQKSTADERSLCNDANDANGATSENTGNVVIPVETV